MRRAETGQTVVGSRFDAACPAIKSAGGDFPLDCLLAVRSITLPLDVAQQFITSPAVDAAIVKFEQDWQGAFAVSLWERASISRNEV